MTNQEFINWLKGFTQACGNKLPSEKQWGLIKEELSKVDKDKILVDKDRTQKNIGLPITGGTTHNYGGPYTYCDDNTSFSSINLVANSTQILKD